LSGALLAAAARGPDAPRLSPESVAAIVGRSRVGETERMPARFADILGKARAAGDEANPVSAQSAGQRMPDGRHRSSRLQERVAAMASVLGAAVAARRQRDAVAEDAAEIADLFWELHG